MGRYRPPPTPKSPYITALGFERLKEEQQELWERRRKVTKALSAAAAEGDRSENAEYIYRKKELREIDRRIRYLEKRLPSVQVVKKTPEQSDQIFFAAWVSLVTTSGVACEYRIVGPDETDHHPNYISLDSPLAQALLKKKLEDQVDVVTPSGKDCYWVTKIWYEQD
jgi:transcription elongation factor GreB